MGLSLKGVKAAQKDDNWMVFPATRTCVRRGVLALTSVSGRFWYDRGGVVRACCSFWSKPFFFSAMACFSGLS